MGLHTVNVPGSGHLGTGRLRRLLCLRRRPSEGWVDYMKRIGVIAARQLKKHGQQRVQTLAMRGVRIACVANVGLPESRQGTQILGRIGDMVL